MEKKYQLPEENGPNDEVREPAVEYLRKTSIQPPCIFSFEEIEDQIKEGIKEKELGLGVSHEEMKKRFKK